MRARRRGRFNPQEERTEGANGRAASRKARRPVALEARFGRAAGRPSALRGSGEPVARPEPKAVIEAAPLTAVGTMLDQLGIWLLVGCFLSRA